MTAAQETASLCKKLGENVETEKLCDVLAGVTHAISIMGKGRDPYTSGHQQAVASISRNIGAALGFDEAKLCNLHIAGLLHDTGKIVIPVSILIKPGKLTDGEFALIKEHPQAGYEILKHIPFPYNVAGVALQHHERLNGKGYPFGIPGQDIMFFSKIVAVADTIEAMTAVRSYRVGFSIQHVLKEVSKGRGSLYDSEVVDVCIKLASEKLLFKGIAH